MEAFTGIASLDQTLSSGMKAFEKGQWTVTNDGLMMGLKAKSLLRREYCIAIGWGWTFMGGNLTLCFLLLYYWVLYVESYFGMILKKRLDNDVSNGIFMIWSNLPYVEKALKTLFAQLQWITLQYFDSTRTAKRLNCMVIVMR